MCLAETGTAFATHQPQLPPLVEFYDRMEVTDFIFKEREDVFQVGDYNAYRAHTTRRLHKLRKKLGQATPKGRKYTAKPAVTAENVGDNVS